ncbi:MAG: Sec-independent protein translocase protein TatB [Rhodobacteraceae bacterium]|nr:Sec-independent protein translocase protein TatB [Paracoccaceae bacterium]
MFDLGMMEILIIGVVALIVVGPKDLPGLFRTVGNFIGKMKGMAREFQRSMDDAAKSSGMGDVMDGVRSATDGVKSATNFNPMDFNKDLKSMTKDAIKKSVTLDGAEKKAALKKVDSEGKAPEKAAKKASGKTAGKVAKKPVKAASSKTVTKKPASKPAAKKTASKTASKTAAKKPASKATPKTTAKKPVAKKAPAKKIAKKDA